MFKLKGISLIELITVLCIMTIGILMSLTSLDEFVTKWQISSNINNLARAIKAARDQAIYQNRSITLCPSNDQTQCHADWHAGLVAFIDENYNLVVDEGEKVILGHGAFRDGDEIYWRAFRRRPYLEMSPQGFTAFQNGTFTYCPREGIEYARGLILNTQGRLRYTTDSDGDGIDEGANDRPLRC